jgi:nucleoid-associated protein YgaU
MMGTRYDDRRILKNDSEEYSGVFKEKKVKYIRQYDTAHFRYPTTAEIQSLNRLIHIWSTGDRYYKLAGQHYGNPGYWWVIAHYNKRPTEADVQLGDMIYVPLPLEKILSYVMD